METADLLISGAGSVGATLAFALKNSALKIILVDIKNKKTSQEPSNIQDQRMIALSLGSIQFLEKIGLWQHLQGFTTPIKHIHVSEQHNSNITLLHAHTHKLDYFGAIISLAHYENTILKLLEQQNNLEIIYEHSVQAYKRLTESLEITLNSINFKTSNLKNTTTINCKLVAAADGTQSFLKTNSGIPFIQHDYDQIAAIANIKCEKAHNNTAYERFTKQGPLALLPINTHEMAVVLTLSREQNIHKPYDTDSFIHILQQRFGSELGELNINGSCQTFPLTLTLSSRLQDGRLSLLGNSAHAMHPIAGQGLNLGIRDVEAYVQLIQKHIVIDPQFKDVSAFEQFNKMRKNDMIKTVGATDLLVRIFENQLPFMPQARNFGLFLINKSKFLQKHLVNFGMGLRP